MDLYLLRVNRTRIQQQITQNLMEAGVLTKDEVEHQISELAKLDAKDLLTVLLESHQLKEKARSTTMEANFVSQYYRIDPWTINSMN